ncbi:MAG: hypothetical protein WC613_05935 [Candidatus Aenigmatarchaeota archaeon]
MNITLSVSGELEKLVKEHPEIKWTELARKGMLSEAKNLKKLSLLRKFVDKEPISEDDFKWMDEHDWHPVDEMKLKPEFVKDVQKRSKGKFRRIGGIKDLFE